MQTGAFATSGTALLLGGKERSNDPPEVGAKHDTLVVRANVRHVQSKQREQSTSMTG